MEGLRLASFADATHLEASFAGGSATVVDFVFVLRDAAATFFFAFFFSDFILGGATGSGASTMRLVRRASSCMMPS